MAKNGTTIANVTPRIPMGLVAESTTAVSAP